MNLPFLKSKPKIEYFLALVLRDDKINVFVFQKDNDVIKVLNSQEEAFADSLDKTSFEDLLDAADKVISQAEDELDLPLEVQKTIFGLKEGWVKDGKIKPESLQILKKLSDSLGLQPIGFLTVSEAVVSLLQKEEGAPPSAILVDVGKNSVIVSSVRAGKVIEVKSAEIHQSSVFTVDTLLKHFEVIEILPAKVVLLNEDEDLVQEFISHQWSKSLPFLHLPQIVSLENDSIAKAYAIGLANQTGAQVQTEFEAPSQPSEQEQTVQKETGEQEPIKQKESEPVEQPIEEVQSNIEYIDTPDFFGFGSNDVAKTPKPKPEVENVDSRVFEEVPEDVELKETGKQLIPAQIMVVLPKIRDLAVQLLSGLRSLNIQGKIPVRDKRIVYIAAPLLLILLFVIYYFFFLKAEVKIFVNSKSAEKQQDIVFSTTASDFKNNTIKADFAQISEDGTVTDPATGQKETGDLAKGAITIRNFGSTSITLPAKTEVSSSHGLNFFTINDVSIASRSATSPTTVSVNVQAEKFGTVYNIPKEDISLSQIGNNSNLTATNDSAFSGGTSKQIQVISKDDTAKAESDLIKNLENKARSDIKSKLSSANDLLPNFFDESLDKKSFDKNVDDEAKSVTLTGTVSFQAVSYNRDDFMNFLKNLFGQNQSIQTNNLVLSFDNLQKISDSRVSASMSAKVKTTPAIDTNSLAKKIAGNSFIKAKNEITGMDQVGSAEIKFSPGIFDFLPNFLPHNSKNIKIVIAAND